MWLCDFRKFGLKMNKCLAAHRQKALCCYLFVLGLALVYVAVNLDSIIRFIVFAPIDSSPPIAGPENASCNGYAMIALMVKRQSVSHDVLLDFGSEMLHPLGAVVVSSLMLINGRGCVPWRSRETGGSVKWTSWLCIVLAICAAMWLVYNIPIRYILCGKSYPSDIQVLHLISSDFQQGWRLLFARRSLLIVCCSLYGLVLSGIVLFLLSFPLLRIVWAKRYVGEQT